MHRLPPELKSEYLRWSELAGDNDNYKSERTIGISDVLSAHFLIADFFLAEGSGLGGIGPKNLDLLHSALYRPHICYAGTYKWNDEFEIIATTIYGLVMDHPFHDANKRTAFLCLLHMLDKAGYTPEVSHQEFEDFLVEIAEHGIEKRSRYQELQRKHDDPEVKYMAWWLRKKTRPIDNRQYIITYRDLKRILNRFDFDIDNPDGNYIDVFGYKTTKPLFGAPKQVKQKLGRIGFPGMSKQVQKGDLRKVRELTGLTKENGIDSQVFYNEADSLTSLINKYKDPLKRLADR